MEFIAFFVILPMGMTLLYSGVLMLVMLGIRALIGRFSGTNDTKAGNKVYWAGMTTIPPLTVFINFASLRQFFHIIIIPALVSYIIFLMIGCVMMDRIDKSSEGTTLERFASVFPQEPKDSTPMLARRTVIVVVAVAIVAAALNFFNVKW